MNSSEGEVIQLIRDINPLDAQRNPRGVEEWLKEVENTMKSTLLHIFKQTVQDFYKTCCPPPKPEVAVAGGEGEQQSQA